MIKVAYWDTEQRGQMPPLLGSISGTPTIKILKPKKKKSKEKLVIEYQQERKAKAMFDFAASHMPYFVERVRKPSDLSNFFAKADRYALPKAIYFGKRSLPPLIKAMSVNYRRKLLIAEVKSGSNTQEIAKKYLESKSGKIALPSLIVLKGTGGDGEIFTFSKKFTYNKVNNFLYSYALKKAITNPNSGKKKRNKKKDKKQKNEKNKQQTKKHNRTENEL